MGAEKGFTGKGVADYPAGYGFLLLVLVALLITACGAQRDSGTGPQEEAAETLTAPSATPTPAPTATASAEPAATTPSPTATAPPPAEGFVRFELPYWVHLDVPETWYQIRGPNGWLAFSSSGTDFPYFQLGAETRLLMVYEVGDGTGTPLEVLEERLLTNLAADRELVGPAEAVEVNGQEAAVASYINRSPTNNADALETLTVMAGEERMLAVLAVTMLASADVYEETFEQIRQTVRVREPYPLPQLSAGVAPPDYETQAIDWQGITLYYPPAWEVESGLRDFTVHPGPGSVPIELRLTLPDEMSTWLSPPMESPSTAGVGVLYSLLVNPFDVLQSISEVVTEGTDPERSAVVLAGTLEGEPMAAVLGAVAAGERVLGVTVLLDDLENVADVIELVKYLELEPEETTPEP